MSISVVRTEEQTLKNLLAAFNGESNAVVRYAAFAIKADEEGYLKVGSLFRAGWHAEQVHAANHAEVIELMGGTPVATIKDFIVRTTVENLPLAIASELYEIDNMYPEFLREAEARKNAAAVRTFKYALDAEKEHWWLFRQALEDIQHSVDQPSRKLSGKATYNICLKCGFTAEQSELNRCALCADDKQNFELVS